MNDKGNGPYDKVVYRRTELESEGIQWKSLVGRDGSDGF